MRICIFLNPGYSDQWVRRLDSMSSRVLRICALSESDSAASWRFCESKHVFLSCGHCINDNDLLTYVLFKWTIVRVFAIVIYLSYL